MRKKDIEKFIDKLIKENDTKDPFKICSYNDIPIIYHSGSYKGVCMKYKNDIVISLRNDLDTLTKFITLAHELFHGFVHYESIDSHEINFFSKRSCVCEDEANYFASRLLLRQDKEYLEYLFEDIVNLDKKIDKIVRSIAESN